jgi:hypothetical protein
LPSQRIGRLDAQGAARRTRGRRKADYHHQHHNSREEAFQSRYVFAEQRLERDRTANAHGNPESNLHGNAREYSRQHASRRATQRSPDSDFTPSLCHGERRERMNTGRG